MSVNGGSDQHVRIYKDVLEIREYNRLFESTVLSVAYKIILSQINRRTIAQLKYVIEGSSVVELARRYEKGKLCTYLEDSRLVDSLGVSSRYVYDIREKLVKAKLLKAEKFKDGFIYELGIRVQHKDADGYSVGKEQEAMYMDSWRSMLHEDELRFRLYLINLLGDPKKKQTAEWRIEIEELMKQRSVAEKIMSIPTQIDSLNPEDCRILQKVLKNSSKNQGSKIYEEQRAEQQKPAVETAPIITIESHKQTKDASSRSTNDSVGLFTSEMSPQEEANLLISELRGLLRSRRVLTFTELMDKKRILAGVGVDDKKFAEIVNSTLPQDSFFVDYPVFSYLLNVSVVPNTKSHLAGLILALKAEISGAAGGSFASANKIAKELLASYEFEHVVWTLKLIAKQPALRRSFGNSIFALKGIISDKFGQWKEFKALQMREAVVVSQKAIDEGEKARQDAEIAQKFAESLEKAISKPVKEEVTLESLQNRLKDTTDPFHRKLIQAQINRFKKEK